MVRCSCGEEFPYGLLADHSQKCPAQNAECGNSVPVLQKELSESRKEIDELRTIINTLIERVTSLEEKPRENITSGDLFDLGGGVLTYRG